MAFNLIFQNEISSNCFYTKSEYYMHQSFLFYFLKTKGKKYIVGLLSFNYFVLLLPDVSNDNFSP